MSFHPWESLVGAIVIPLLVFVIPIHFSALLTVLAIMTFFGVTNHMGWELFSRSTVHGRIGKWLITASHHDRHHRDYNSNFGLYFRHWDRLCGTRSEEHTSELQSLMRISYAVFCLKKTKAHKQ